MREHDSFDRPENRLVLPVATVKPNHASRSHFLPLGYLGLLCRIVRFHLERLLLNLEMIETDSLL